jgi:nucleoid-associated protein YgaU
MESAIDRLKGAGDNVLDGTASGQLRGGDYIYEGTRQTQRATEGLVAMLRKFLEVSRPKRQRTHIVREGDTLQRLAKIYLGDYTRWTEIADANDLVTSELVVGFSLLIPRR